MDTAQAREMVDQLREWFGDPEDLDPELITYVCDSDIGTSIKHPLVYSILHHDVLNARVNAQLRQKKIAVAEAYRDGEWYSYVFLHERPYRVDAFTVIEHLLEDGEYWELLGSVWTDSENIWQNYEVWRDLLTESREDRERMMSEEERAELAALPSEFTIYRGAPRTEEFDIPGLSWTLDRQRGEWFAHRSIRFGTETRRDAVLHTATVNKADVLAFFDGRGEREIVVLPEDVNDPLTTIVEPAEKNGE